MNLTCVAYKTYEKQWFSRKYTPWGGTEKSEKIVLAKNSSGDPTNFKIETIVNIEVRINKKLKNNFIIIEDFNYNNNSDKFSLRRYEKEIKNNLADTVTDKLIFRLSNIQWF